MPPISPLANLFAKSPFKAIQQHMRVVLACAQEVRPLFEAVNAGDRDGIIAASERISEKEHEADRIKNELRGHLPRTLFMPVDRRDLLEVLQMQDTIANSAQDIAGLLARRPMAMPPAMHEPIAALVDHCIDACEEAASIIEELDELVETGFRGRESQKVEAMADEVNRIEHESDLIEDRAVRTLFEHEAEIGAVSVMMWYQIIQWIGDLADYAEKVGDRLRLTLSRS